MRHQKGHNDVFTAILDVFAFSYYQRQPAFCWQTNCCNNVNTNVNGQSSNEFKQVSNSLTMLSSSSKVILLCFDVGEKFSVSHHICISVTYLHVKGRLTKQEGTALYHKLPQAEFPSQMMRPNLFEFSVSLLQLPPSSTLHPTLHLLQGTRNTSAGCGSTLAPIDTLTGLC